MKKKSTAYIIIAISFILFNILAFFVPGGDTPSFYTAYAFSAVAFAAQIFIWKFSIGSETELRSKIFKITIVNTGIVYLVLQCAAFAVFKFCSDLPVWLAAVVCSVILCVSAAGLITAGAAVTAGIEKTGNTERKISAKRRYIQEIQVEVELLAEAETEADIKNKLLALAKKIRLSDPMSNDSLAGLENSISEKINGLKTAGADKNDIISEIDMLLSERNKKCKMMKG